MPGVEHLIWTDVRRGLLKLDRNAHLCRVENGVGGGGMPDASACVKGVECWIETKGMDRWPRVSHDQVILPKHGITRAQYDWHRAHWLAGGNNWVILGVRTTPVEWYIWKGPVGVHVYGRTTQIEWKESATIHAFGPFPAHDFVDAIRDRAHFTFS